MKTFLYAFSKKWECVHIKFVLKMTGVVFFFFPFVCKLFRFMLAVLLNKYFVNFILLLQITLHQEAVLKYYL